MVREQRIAVHVIPGVVVKGQKLQHTCLSPSEISAVIKQRSIYKTPSLYNVQYRKQSPTNESPTFRGLDLYRLATFCTIGVITKTSIQSIRVFILVGVLAPNRATFCQPTNTYPTPRKYAFLSCGHLDFESVVTEQRIQGSFDSSYSRSFNVKTWPRNSILSLNNFRYVR